MMFRLFLQIFAAMLACLYCSLWAYAQTPETATDATPSILLDGADIAPFFIEEDTLSCIEEKYEFVGPESVKALTNVDYVIRARGDITLQDTEYVRYELYKDGERIESHEGIKYARSFVEPGGSTITAFVRDRDGCEYRFEKSITVYERIIVFIGEERAELRLGFEDEFEKQATFFLMLPFSGEPDPSVANRLTRLVSENLYHVKHADSLVIASAYTSAVMESLWKLQTVYNLDFSSTALYLVTTESTYVAKRVFSKYLRTLGIEAFWLVPEPAFINLLLGLSTASGWYVPEDEGGVRISFDRIPRYQLFSYAVDYLIFQEFPVTLLAWLLSLTVAVTFLNFARQIVWLHTFGLFYPLLFAFSFAFLNVALTLLLFIVAFVCILAVNAFSARVYIMHNGRIALVLIAYIALSFLLLLVASLWSVPFLRLDIMQNVSSIFPYLAILLVAYRIFDDDFHPFRLDDILYLVQLFLVSFAVFFILNWNWLQNFLLSFPEVILLILGLNIAIARFTGLQLSEYLRFLPLLRRNVEEE